MISMFVLKKLKGRTYVNLADKEKQKATFRLISNNFFIFLFEKGTQWTIQFLFDQEYHFSLQKNGTKMIGKYCIRGFEHSILWFLSARSTKIHWL
jgi:hypothetical protein